MRLHVYYGERIFNRPEPLRRVGHLAATHHERMDGSGYHRGVGATMLSMPARVLAAPDARSRFRAGGPAGLTARESDVLGLLARGLPNKGIARQLGISPKTVGNHIERIYTKLGVSNRAGAAMSAMQHGLVASTPARTD